MLRRSQSLRSALLIVFSASFAVYLVPVFGPHTSGSLGPCAADWTYLRALPSRLFAGRAKAPDLGDWKTVCTVPDMEVAEVRSPPDASLPRAGQAWLQGNGEYAVLTMPGCQTRSIRKPDAATQADLSFASPAGVYLLRNWDGKTRQTHWWVGNGSLRLLSRLPDTPPMFGMPVLSNDGHWVAWMESIAGTKLRRAVVQSLDDEQVHFVDIPNQRLLEWELLAADMKRKELTFYDYDYTTRRSSLTVLGLGSEQHGDSIVAQGVDAQFTTMLHVGSGWVAWDAAREPGERYRIAWSLAGGRGTHEASRGRSITAVKVDPAGAYVAISETNALRADILRDAVYVLRTSDGKEVWHRNLPGYAGSSVAFLGEKFLAYTDSDGAHFTVRVLQIPN